MPFPGNRPEIINIGDSLTITFFDLPIVQQPIDQQVRGDGTITLIDNQTFKVDGKTRGELEKEIRARYVPRLYPRMTVAIKPFERFFFVGGEVRGPGAQRYIGPITVLKAIQSAGDFTDFAQRKKIRLTRLDGKKLIINWYDAQQDPRLDPPVYPGDTIHVPRRIF
jgi:polysaccharide export outer membrane protein